MPKTRSGDNGAAAGPTTVSPGRHLGSLPSSVCLCACVSVVLFPRMLGAYIALENLDAG